MSIRRTVTADQAEWSLAPLPAWYEPREVDWRYRAVGEENSVWLLSDVQHHVASQSCTRRAVRQLLSMSAVQALAQVEIEFDPAADRLLLHELVVWRQAPDGAWRKGTPVPAEAFLARQREQQLEQQILTGQLSLVALLEDVRVGDVVDLCWTIAPRERLPDLAFTTYHAFAWAAPVARACFALHLDPAQPVRWRLHPGGDGPLPTEERTEGAVCWMARDLPRFEGESNVPGSHWHWPLLEVSAWSSWQRVAMFIAGLWDEALCADAALVAEEAVRLAADVPRERAVLEAIRFVQEEVRYLAVDFGHGAGLLPNGAGTVLRRRFGDCKDKSVLLCALLRALGLHAAPVLVASNWREAVTRLMPSTGAFSHAIVMFEFEGRRMYVDPTCIGQRGDLQHRVSPRFGVGLEVLPMTTALSEIPGETHASLCLTETFDLDARGKGRVLQELVVEGGMADDLRALLLRDGPLTFARRRIEVLREHFPAVEAEPESVEFDDDPDANRLTMTGRHALPTWGKAGEPLPPRFNYGAYGLLLGLDQVNERESRQQPWWQRHPLQLTHRVRVRGPRVQRPKPSRYTHEGPGFRFSSVVSSRRREAEFEYEWRTLVPAIAAAEWPAYLRERGEALEYTGAQVVTEGMSLWRALRICIGVFLACVFLARIAVQEEAPPALTGTQRADIERRVGTAFDAARAGDFAKVHATLAPLMVHYRGQFDVQNLWAEAALHTGHFDAAAEAIRITRKLDPAHVLPRRLEANLAEQRGDFVAARALLDELAVRPQVDPGVLVDRARVIERSGDRAAARAAWEQVLARQPAQPDALFAFASLLWQAGDEARADQVIEAALRAQPTPSAVLEGVALRYFGTTGRHARALRSARRAAELAPADPAVLRALVMALLNAGERGEAESFASGLTTRFPDSPLAWGAYATAAAVAGHYPAAGPAFERWVRLAPDDPDAHSSRGFFLHVSGDDPAARDVLAAGVARFPSFGTLWLNYAVVLEALGDPKASEARRKAESLMTPEQRAHLVR